MIYILLGSTGFLLGYLSEYAARQRWPWLKPIFGISAGGLILYALLGASLYPARFWLPAWSPPLGWLLLVIASALLAYSLFFELPRRYTYLASGPSPYLVRSGTYALVRHPTILWFCLLLLSLLIVSRSQLLLIALPIWAGLDILWAVLQETWVLRRTFPEYAIYQQETPMLIPNQRSLRACLRSLQIAWSKKQPI